MNKIVVALALLVSMTFTSVAQAHVVQSADGDPINVRMGPDLSFGIVTTMRGDEGATLIGQEGSWYKVRLATGVEGYVADYVTRLTFADQEVYAVITTDVLNVRSGPDLDARQLGQIGAGERFRLHEVLGNWWRIEYQGSSGWILGQYAHQAVGESVEPPDQEPEMPIPRSASGMGVTLRSASGTLRVGPSRDQLVAARVSEQDAFTYIGSAEGWIHLQLQNGTTGWIHGAEVELWAGDAWPLDAYYDVKEGYWQIALWPVRTLTQAYPLRLAPTESSGNSGVLAAQTTMQVLATSGQWTQVQVADGRQGWVPVEMAQGSLTAEDSVENTILKTVSPGVYRLELEGRLAGASVNPTDQGISVLIPDSSGRTGRMDIRDSAIDQMVVDERGVHLGMTNLLHVTVIEQTGTRLVLQLAPIMTGITQREEDGNQIYHISVVGNATASTAIDGATVTVSLARTHQTGVVPAGVGTAFRGTTLDIRFESERPFVLKKVNGGYDVIFYAFGLAGKVIMIDPGHGGFDPGAVHNGLQEAAVNLDVSLRLRDLLTAEGATVLMTRTDSSQALPSPVIAALSSSERSRADLNYRTVLANQHQVDLFISVHHNAAGRGARGIETYYSTANMNSASSKLLADMVQAALLFELGLHNRRVQIGSFYVIRHTQGPAILAEIAFLSDLGDAAFIAVPANRQRAAQALAKAIAQFFDQGKPPAPEPEPEPEPVSAEFELDELRRRLKQDPTSLLAYEAYFRKAAALGVHRQLDTFIDGKQIDYDVRPFVMGDRTLAPIRALTEAIGAKVEWEQSTQRVTITKDGKVIQLQIGSHRANVNGLDIFLDVPAALVESRTVVPLRFVSETFGLEVTWMAEFAGIVLTSQSVQVPRV